MNQAKQILFSEEEVTARLVEMAGELARRYTGKRPLFVCLLRGAVPFTAALMSQLAKLNPDFHPEVDYMEVSAYGQSRSLQKLVIKKDLDNGTDIKGRFIVVLDDVLDSGTTVDWVAKHLLGQGAASVEVVVMIQKDKLRKNWPQATLYGFEVPDKWIVGMGMDDAKPTKEGYRWANYIGIVD